MITNSVSTTHTEADTLPLRILVAEDNPVNQLLIRHNLKKLGYEPDLVKSGIEVLQALEQQSYSLILMDVYMPEMDGLETTLEIVRRYGSDRPLIFAITANIISTDIDRYLTAGMSDYLSKPFKPEDLQEKINKWKQALQKKINN